VLSFNQYEEGPARAQGRSFFASTFGRFGRWSNSMMSAFDQHDVRQLRAIIQAHARPKVQGMNPADV
jgi:hypothetical protein